MTNLCHVKRNYLTKFYIFLKKCEKLQYLQNNMTDLHKIWHDYGEHVCEVIGY